MLFRLNRFNLLADNSFNNFCKKSLDRHQSLFKIQPPTSNLFIKITITKIP